MKTLMTPAARSLIRAGPPAASASLRSVNHARRVEGSIGWLLSRISAIQRKMTWWAGWKKSSSLIPFSLAKSTTWSGSASMAPRRERSASRLWWGSNPSIVMGAGASRRVRGRIVSASAITDSYRCGWGKGNNPRKKVVGDSFGQKWDKNE